MKSDQSDPALPGLPRAPYVGMRPYEADERQVFVGRDRDAAVLCDKIFSARLTVFYGPSGIGKSSILRTLVVPYLEEQEARVIYFDDWRSEDPVGTLRARLVNEATRLGIANSGAGAPTLTDLGRLLISVDQRTVVLILDQFEEFFTAPGRRVGALRNELVGVIRTPDLDVRVLISLREEHLAALEPFRSELVTLFQSTFRLEPLSETGAREAIDAPARLFGAVYEAELVDELLRDLRHDRNIEMGPVGDASTEPIDLPLLQLVCDELWKQMGSREPATITTASYRVLGGKPGILSAYLNRVMPRGRQDRGVTAALMRHLAPPDGHKAPFSAEHLADLTEFSATHVQYELDRLAEARVLRTHQYEDGYVLYELAHDSFIRIIVPWRDEVLRRTRRRRRSLQAASVLALITIVTVSALWGNDRRELYSNTEGMMSRNDRSPAQKFDHVALYLLWARSGTSRLDVLRDLLKKYAAGLPENYGTEVAGLAFMTLLDQREDWPLVVHYSSGRQLDPHIFQQEWHGFARFFNEKWGIPVPTRLQLRAEPTYPLTLIRVTGQKIEPLEFDMPAYERDADAYISSADISKPGKEFLEQFSADWKPITAPKHGGPFWVVPRWSIPAWKAAGTKVNDGRGLVAFIVALELQKHPDRLLSAPAVEMLLANVAKRYPKAVAEARAVRKDLLVADLQEFVKQGRGLTNLSHTLEILAQYSQGTPGEIAQRVVADDDSLRPSLPSVLRGPHPLTTWTPVISPAYRDTDHWLPRPQPPVRVYVGDVLSKKWMTPDRKFRTEFNYALERIREDIMRRRGLDVRPSVRIAGEWDRTIPASAFIVEILNQDVNHPDAAPISVTAADALDRLSEVVTSSVDMARVHFVTADIVGNELAVMDRPLAAWLKQRYSTTDLKALLRAVVLPTADEIAGQDKALGGLPHHTIGNTSWLLASLVFWTKVHDGRSLPALTQDLRATQRARLSGIRDVVTNTEVAALIDRGIGALEEGRIADAQEAFAVAVKTDQRSAITAFLNASASRRTLLRTLGASCAKLDSVLLGTADRVSLEDLLKDPQLERNAGAATARRLRLCLLAVYPATHRQESRRASSDLLGRYGTADTWPADEAAWFGAKLLDTFDPLTDDKSIAETGMTFVRASMLRLERRAARHVMERVVNTCGRPGPSRWCWDLLPRVGELASDPWIPVKIGWALAQEEVLTDVERALAAATRARAQIADAPLEAKEKKTLSSWTELIRAQAGLSLIRLGAGTDADAKALERTLVDLRSAALDSHPVRILAALLRYQQRFREASVVVEAALQRWPDDAPLHGEKLNLALIAGDRDAVSRVATDALKRAKHDRRGCHSAGLDDDRLGLCFVGTLGLLITETGPWEQVAREFLTTEHPYVPYIAMLLYARMTGQGGKEAREVAERFWTQADNATLAARLDGGDASAWREMLIGYYLEKVPGTAIFADLEDERRYATSNLRHVPLPRLGMLCEAYFYDAMLAEARGDRARAESSFNKTLTTNVRHYLEYSIAKYLLEAKATTARGRK